MSVYVGTAGHIASEVIDKQGWVFIHPNFGSIHDSGGVVWDDRLEIEHPTVAPLVTLLQVFVDLGLSWRITPGRGREQWLLDLWQQPPGTDLTTEESKE